MYNEGKLLILLIWSWNLQKNKMAPKGIEEIELHVNMKDVFQIKTYK